MSLRLVLQPYCLRLRRPLVTGFGVMTERRGILLGLEGGGHRGWGEAAPLPGFGGEPLPTAAGALRSLEDACQGWPAVLDWHAISAICQDFAAAHPDHPCSAAALEQALCDLAARQAGLPLWAWLQRHWGLKGLGRGGGRVVVNATLGADAPARLGQEARAAAEAGYRTLKVKLLGEVEDDLLRLAAVRAAVGPEVRLRADANGGWRSDQAEHFLAALALRDVGVDYVEQPVAPGSDLPSAAAALRTMAGLRRLGIPLAADESLLAPGGAAAVLEAGAADHLILKPQLLGGLGAAAAIARTGLQQGLGVTVTSALDSAVGVLGALHLVVALGLDGAHGLSTGSLFAEDLVALPRPVDGVLLLPLGSGIGLEPPRADGLSANA